MPAPTNYHVQFLACAEGEWGLMTTLAAHRAEVGDTFRHAFSPMRLYIVATDGSRPDGKTLVSFGPSGVTVQRMGEVLGDQYDKGRVEFTISNEDTERPACFVSDLNLRIGECAISRENGRYGDYLYCLIKVGEEKFLLFGPDLRPEVVARPLLSSRYRPCTFTFRLQPLLVASATNIPTSAQQEGISHAYTPHTP